MKNILSQIVIILVTGLLSTQGFTVPLPEAKTLIPLEFGRMPSSDLMYQGRMLTPDEAKQMVIESNGQFDLSELDPTEASDIWKNKEDSLTIEDDDRLPVSEESTLILPHVKYTMGGLTGLGVITAEVEGDDTRTPYQFMIGRRTHPMLLRKALLRKLGYKISELKYIKKATFKFRNSIDKEVFVTKLAKGDTETDTGLGDIKRWIIEDNNETNELVIQDIIVYSSSSKILNLYSGTVKPSYVRGRRLLRSLLVPYNLLNVKENVNLFSWETGKIINNSLYLAEEFSHINFFYPTIDDVKWIAKRIAKLTREDFEQIVKEAEYPLPVEKVLIEKLISRRNNLMRLINLDIEPLEFNPSVSYGEKLKNGKLINKDDVWPGYASRFTYGDPESPLDSSEIFAYGKSMLMSTAIQETILKLNKIIPESDLRGAILDHQINAYKENINHYIKTGEVRSTPFGLWATPTFGGKIILSREIVAGPLMGTDNLIQIADTVGYSLRTGAFIGVDGVKSSWLPSGGVGASFRRTFTHLKPIYSMKAALKEPLKNMIVPIYKANLVKEIHKVIEYGKKADQIEKTMLDMQKPSEEITTEDIVKMSNLNVNPINAIGILIQKEEILKARKVFIDNVVGCEKDDNILSSISNAKSACGILDELQSSGTVANMAVLQGITLKGLKTLVFDHNVPVESILKILKKHRGIKTAAMKAKANINIAIRIYLAKDLKATLKDFASKRMNKLQKLLRILKESLGQGESLIITDSIGANITANASKSFYSPTNMKILASINQNNRIVNRLHITRDGKDNIQVYKDKGHVSGLGLSVQLKDKVRILSISSSAAKGKAKTQYHSLNIGAQGNKKLVANLQAIAQLLKSGSLKPIEQVSNPYYVHHKFSKRKLGLGLFHWDVVNLHQKDSITVENYKGDTKNFYLTSRSHSFETNYQKFLLEAANEMISQFDFPTSGSSNAEGTIYGKKKKTKVSIEAEITQGALKGTFGKIEREWKGWSISKSKAQDILDDMNDKYDMEFYSREFLNNTEKIQLYNITLQMLIYKSGIDHFAKIRRSTLKKMLGKHLTGYCYGLSDISTFGKALTKKEQHTCNELYSIYRNHHKYNKRLKKGQIKKSTQNLLSLLQKAESVLPFKEFLTLVGGKENIYIFSRISGFLLGDERGDDANGGKTHTPFTSNTIGEFGSSNRFGPLYRMRQFLGLTESEFLAHWIRER